MSSSSSRHNRWASATDIASATAFVFLESCCFTPSHSHCILRLRISDLHHLLTLLMLMLQQPELDPVTQAATKAELDRGLDKTTSFPVDGKYDLQLVFHSMDCNRA